MSPAHLVRIELHSADLVDSGRQGHGNPVDRHGRPCTIPVENEVLRLPAAGNSTLAFIAPYPGRLEAAQDVIEGNQIDVLVADVTPLPSEGVELKLFLTCPEAIRHPFCRFHDLRVTCITKLAEPHTLDLVIMSVAGRVSRAMLEHYSRIRTEAKRAALEGLSSPNSKGAVHQNVPQIPSGISAVDGKLLN